jgi:hypothetical protein
VEFPAEQIIIMSSHMKNSFRFFCNHDINISIFKNTMQKHANTNTVPATTTSGDKSANNGSNAIIAEIEKLIESEENAVGLDPGATFAAMEAGAVFDAGPGTSDDYGPYRKMFHICITASVAGSRVKIGGDNRLTARVGTALLTHYKAGLISRYRADYDSFLATAEAISEKLNTLAEFVRCDGRYVRLPMGGFGSVVSRQGSAVVVRIKGRLHVLTDGNLKPLRMAA